MNMSACPIGGQRCWRPLGGAKVMSSFVFPKWVLVIELGSFRREEYADIYSSPAHSTGVLRSNQNIGTAPEVQTPENSSISSHLPGSLRGVF